MRWVDNNNIAIILSEKSDGDMLFKNDNQSLNKDIKLNRQRFFQKNNIDSSRTINIAGSHGNNIYIAKEQDLAKGTLNSKTRIKNADGLITAVKNSYLMVTGADCFPIFFYDEQYPVIGVAHCGWRGVIKNIISATIDKFKENFSSRPENLKIWVGPGIKSCHFQVQKDVVKLFENQYEEAIMRKNSKCYIDLSAIIRSQLTKNDINAKNTMEHADCTYCLKEKWFSHRRDKIKPPVASAFIICLK